MRAEMGKDPSRAPSSQQLNLPPGFRFFPTDEELVVHYLCKKTNCEPFAIPIIAEIELYKFDPWDLPERALFGEKEWYFFSPRDRKYPNGSRPNRAAGTGYWKATGTDKPIHSTSGNKKVGVKKALVFYRGKAPKGIKTNWIMHEYRLADSAARSAKKKGTLRLDDWVLCRIYKKCSAAMSAQRVDKAKEQSETSGLDNVMASVPVFPSRPGSDLGSNYDDAYVDDKQAVMLQNWYGNSKTHPTTGASEYNLYAQQQLQGRMFGGSVAEETTQKHSGITFEQQVAASSADVSNVGSPSNVYSSRHTSEVSIHDDDAAESTFNTLPSFSAEQLNVFPQSLYGLDATGLLPSPTSLMVGQAGSFSSLLEADCNGFFASTDYNLQMRPFAKGPHLGTWDNKISFAT